MMKRYSQISFLLGILFFVTGIQPIWAVSTPISLEIATGPSGGFGYSSIHAATGCSSNGYYMCGNKYYQSLTGTLFANQDNTTYALTDIMGTLTATEGQMIISDGQLSPGTGGYASGFLNYTLTDALNETGTFYFVAKGMCCPGAPNGGPNNLTDSGFTLWGNNWDVMAGETRDSINGDRTPLGIDLVGGNYTTTPEPSTMILLGSGLLALPFLRKKKR